MKLIATLLSLTSFLFVFSSAQSQDITGIWKGHFYQQSLGFIDRYRFEIQIEQLPNSGINGVTYSYKTTVFYGKANLKGVFKKNTKHVVLTETKLVEVKIGDKSDPCLMTCYLDYTKMGTLEILSGTYTSRNLKDSSDCGSGKIYLEKSATSDFFKEDFLVKREQRNARPAAKPAPKPAAKAPVRKPATAATKPQGIKPGAESNILKPAPKTNTATVIAPPKKEETEPKYTTPKLTMPKPEVMRKRVNEVAKTITTNSRQIKIDLYDNGEIDGDTITVYHNNKCIASKKMLTHKPITFHIEADENTPYHEFVMVAENLGSIPPNTALMIVTAGDKRYEMFLTSTEQKNAVVVIEYKE